MTIINAETFKEIKSKEELDEFLTPWSIVNRISPEKIAQLKSEGWRFKDHYIEQTYGGYKLGVEFCIGDFCVSIGSKGYGWLLEPKVRCDTFEEVETTLDSLRKRINSGEHWNGETD